MVSFYPGPSKIHPEVKDYMQEAVSSGILSVNHRSPDFIELSKNTIALLKLKLAIPQEYSVYFISSATEAWEIIAQEFVNDKFLHIYNGAFGQKWAEYAQKLKPSFKTRCIEFGLDEEMPIDKIEDYKDCQVFCITQNETSNGTRVSKEILKKIRQDYPESLIAVDATSSMGGDALDFSSGDIWFASVQKCFGLPAGMALMICSSRVIEKLVPCSKSNHYNSILFMNDMMQNWQTTCTPNVLSIFLLNKVLEQSNSISLTSELLYNRSVKLYDFFSKVNEITCLVANTKLRSTTVLALTASEEVISKVKKTALAKGVLIGNGYGKWKSTTVRIANFPAHFDPEFELLKTIF